MPNFNEIYKEIRGEGIPKTPYDIVRRRYLGMLSEKTGRNTILYYFGWLQRPLRTAAKFVLVTMTKTDL